MYYGVLRINLPEGVKTVGFGDDLAMVIEAMNKEEVVLRANLSIALICN